jgi:hypothetical protein
MNTNFIKYTRTASQSVSANSVVICNVLEASSGNVISPNTTTGQITLTSGKTYRLRGTAGTIVGATAASFIGYGWYNETTSAWIGEGAQIISPSSLNYNVSNGGTAEVVITTNTSTLVSLRVITATNITSIGGNQSDFAGTYANPWIDIEEIGSTFALTSISGLTTTSDVNVGGNLTVTGAISASGNISASNLYITNAIYAYELHTIIESSSVILSSGSNQIGDQQSDILTITGSLLQTGSTSFSELTGSLAAFSSSLNSRIGTVSVGTLSASIYQTDATQSNNITIVSASAWGAYTSASSYSGSFYTTLSTLAGNITTAQNSANGAYASASAYSSSFYTTINTNISNITQASASVWGAFQSASSYSGSFYTTINTVIGNVTTAQNSANGAYASASAYSASAATTYALISGSNSFVGTQSINGSLTVTGDVTAYYSSDERLKDNIQLISNPIEKVQKLRGVEFDWNDKVQMYAGEHSYGVIAQDVLNVMPELVKQRYDGYYGVDYEKMVGLLIEVVKNQEKRIKDLENKMDSK